MHDRLRTLDDEGGLYDQSLAAEAARGLRMLEHWRRTHSASRLTQRQPGRI